MVPVTRVAGIAIILLLSVSGEGVCVHLRRHGRCVLWQFEGALDPISIYIYTNIVLYGCSMSERVII